MKRIGIDLGVIEQPPKLPVGPPDCPGGLLRLTRHDFDSWESLGERFITPRAAIPVDGYGSVRIACRQPVTEVANPVGGGRVFHGLCGSCQRAEENNRATLRERQAPKVAK